MERPLVLVVRGIGDPGQLAGLKPDGFDVSFFDLCPLPGGYSVEAYADLLDHRLRRPTILVGVSIGAAIALAMRSTWVRQVIAVEPFLRTAHLWPMVEFGRQMALPNGGEEARFWNQALGIYPDRLEERVFPINTTAPIHVITGSDPLRSDGHALPFPSFTSFGDKALLATFGATFEAVPGGHGGPVENPSAILAAIHRSHIPQPLDTSR